MIMIILMIIILMKMINDNVCNDNNMCINDINDNNEMILLILMCVCEMKW